MTSRRLMEIGDSIMNLRSITTNNASSLLDKSSKTIITKTISTNATPKRNNIKHIIYSYSLNKKKLINKDKLLTDLNNLNIKYINNSSKYLNNNCLKKYIYTEPRKESIDLISNADKILKDRINKHLIGNPLVKSVFMKKIDETRLNNYKIKLMNNKRNELNNKIFDRSNAIKTTEKDLEKDYNNFVNFVEHNNELKKSQDFIFHKYKNILDEQEIEYNKENKKNKQLKNSIEHLIKKILILKNYGSFIHKVFNKDFIYESIQKSNEKNYLNIADDIIKIYENNIQQDNSDNILSDEYLLMTQFNEYKQNIANILNEKEFFVKDLKKIEYEENLEIIKLSKRIKELEIKLEMVEEEKNKFLKSIKVYNPPEINDIALDCIGELNELLGGKNIQKNETNYTVLSSNLITNVKEKEVIINEKIEEIENVINGDNNNDKLLIEEIISERKKEIKKKKLTELIKQQNEEIKKKNKKSVEKSNRIVFKGRKVMNYRFIKPKKIKKRIITKSHDNDEYIFYSSDEEEKYK